jgi:hypothetical protein
LVADFDVIDFLHTLATHSGTHSGVLLNAVMASSAEETRLVELHELQTTKGPCLGYVRSGHPCPG